MKMFIMPAVALAVVAVLSRPAALESSELRQTAGGADDPVTDPPGEQAVFTCNSPALYSQACPKVWWFDECDAEWVTCRPKSVYPSNNVILCDPDQGTVDPCNVFGCKANGEINDVEIKHHPGTNILLECVVPDSTTPGPLETP